MNLPSTLRAPNIPQTPTQLLTHSHTHSQLHVQSSPQYNTSSGSKTGNCQNMGKKRNSAVENML